MITNRKFKKIIKRLVKVLEELPKEVANIIRKDIVKEFRMTDIIVKRHIKKLDDKLERIENKLTELIDKREGRKEGDVFTDKALDENIHEAIINTEVPDITKDDVPNFKPKPHISKRDFQGIVAARVKLRKSADEDYEDFLECMVEDYKRIDFYFNANMTKHTRKAKKRFLNRLETIFRSLWCGASYIEISREIQGDPSYIDNWCYRHPFIKEILDRRKADG